MQWNFLTSLVIVQVMKKYDTLTLEKNLQSYNKKFYFQISFWENWIFVQHFLVIILMSISQVYLVQILCTINLAHATRMNLKLQKKSIRERKQWEKIKKCYKCSLAWTTTINWTLQEKAKNVRISVWKRLSCTFTYSER